MLHFRTDETQKFWRPHNKKKLASAEFSPPCQSPVPAGLRRLGKLVQLLGLSLAELSDYCNRAVPKGRLFLILSGMQRPTPFEQRAMVEALRRALREREARLFEV